MRGARLASFLGLALASPARLPRQGARHRRALHRRLRTGRAGRRLERHRRRDYRIAGGKLTVSNAHNHPAWLRRRLPHDVVIDVDALSKSPAGDIKLELFGDGESFDPGQGALHVVGLRPDLRRLEQLPVRHLPAGGARRRTQGRRAATSASSRTGATTSRSPGKAARIDWKIDGQPFLAWTDPGAAGRRGARISGRRRLGSRADVRQPHDPPLPTR